MPNIYTKVVVQNNIYHNDAIKHPGCIFTLIAQVKVLIREEKEVFSFFKTKRYKRGKAL